jgi:hypothetical protein
VRSIVADSDIALLRQRLGVDAGSLLFNTTPGVDNHDAWDFARSPGGLEEQASEVDRAFGDRDFRLSCLHHCGL